MESIRSYQCSCDGSDSDSSDDFAGAALLTFARAFRALLLIAARARGSIEASALQET